MHAFFEEPPVHHPLRRSRVLALSVRTRVDVAQAIDVEIVMVILARRSSGRSSRSYRCVLCRPAFSRSTARSTIFWLNWISS